MRMRKGFTGATIGVLTLATLVACSDSGPDNAAYPPEQPTAPAPWTQAEGPGPGGTPGGAGYAPYGGGGYAPSGYASGAPEGPIAAPGQSNAEPSDQELLAQGVSPEEVLARSQRNLANAEQGVYQQIMRDPQVQAAWQAEVARGNQVSLYDYAVWWGRTAGGANTQGWVNSQNAIAERQRSEMAAYRGWSNDLARGQRESEAASRDGRSMQVGGVLRGMQVEGRGAGCLMVAHVQGAPDPYASITTSAGTSARSASSQAPARSSARTVASRRSSFQASASRRAMAWSRRACAATPPRRTSAKKASSASPSRSPSTSRSKRWSPNSRITASTPVPPVSI